MGLSARYSGERCAPWVRSTDTNSCCAPTSWSMNSARRVLGELPAMGMITLNVAEHSLWHWSSLQTALQAVPMVATGLMLVTVAVMLNRGSKAAR